MRQQPQLPGPLSALTLASLALLGGCLGGGSSEPEAPVLPASVTVSGVVADGPLQGATACYDLNDNLACDEGEPRSAASDAAGRYAIDVRNEAAGQHAVVVVVPAAAVDTATGAAVGAEITLRAPATGAAGAQAVFVSALTDAVVDAMATDGLSRADATAQVQQALGLAVSPLADFTATGGDAAAALAARALTSLTVATTQLAERQSVPAAQAKALVAMVTRAHLAEVATALADSSAADPAARVAAAVAAVHASLNLNDSTVAAAAQSVASPAGVPDAPGPFVSVRRFTYTSAGDYSYTLFTGDSSATDAAGEFVADEQRKTVSAGVDQPFNRNQLYWTGSGWHNCAARWRVSTHVKQDLATGRQTSVYCGGLRAASQVSTQDIGGRTLREVVAQIRAYPLPDHVGTHTDAVGLPVNWGPDPALLAAEASFPAGARLSTRQTRVDVGGTDRIELASKSNVRWPDGVYRQATTLTQYSGMAGNLASAAVVPGNGNTVYVADLPLADQPDGSLEAFKRYRAGFDVAALKLRFYRCDVRKTDQAALNCATVADGTLAISSQGDARLMRVASGYPAELRQRLQQQRFWAERSGTVFRGNTDRERLRSDQRLNGPAWTALREALGLPAPEVVAKPADKGPFLVLRSFSYTDAANYDWRAFVGDSSMPDANGYVLAREDRRILAQGVLQPKDANRLYWTGSDWYQCGVDPDSGSLNNSVAPYDGYYCRGYVDEVVSETALTVAGRRMADVVNDIRAYGGIDLGRTYSRWGPNPAQVPALASVLFPVGAEMSYRGSRRTATPLALAVGAGDQVRVTPPGYTNEPFETWPMAGSLDAIVAAYPGNLKGGPLNGAASLWVWGYQEAQPAGSQYTSQMEIRVAFDPNGQKARFSRNNRSASTGFTTNHQVVLDTTYTVQTVGGLRLLRFAALPDGFADRFGFERLYGERNGGVWYAFKDTVPASTMWSIRLNAPAARALATTLGISVD